MTKTGIEPAAFGTGIRRWKERRKVMSDEMIRVERREKSDERRGVFGGSNPKKRELTATIAPLSHEPHSEVNQEGGRVSRQPESNR